jgi:hypothetical protein
VGAPPVAAAEALLITPPRETATPLTCSLSFSPEKNMIAKVALQFELYRVSFHLLGVDFFTFAA